MTNLPTEVARLKREVAQVKKGQRLSHGASIENAAIEVRDDDGSLRAIVGQQGDGTTGAVIVNGPPPPQPSAPIVASVLGGVTASWDGQFDAGAVMPLDWARVEVHVSTSSDFTPDPVTLQSTVETAQGATVVIPCENDVYVRFLARTTSGTASAPSVTVGPYGPTPVVATDILDGIVTTLKLADDAVTQAKVATGAIGTTEINDNAITTAKVVAGAIQAAQLDALAVTAGKIAAGAVTTAKLDALAVTAAQIAANTITATKLAAGSVDATALKADAITGKTITGGTITGTDIIGGTVTGGLLRTGTVNERVVITPTPPSPIVQRASVLLYSGATDEIGPGLLNSGVTSGQPSTILGSPCVATDSSSTQVRTTLGLIPPKPGSYGGRFVLTAHNPNTNSQVGRVSIDAQTGIDANGAASFEIAAVDGVNNPRSAVILLGSGKAKFSAQVVEIAPAASSLSALLMNSPSGHTGLLAQLQKSSVNKFTVDGSGNTTIAGTATIGGAAAVTGDVSVSGILTAGNSAKGTATITPSAAHTPTSTTVFYSITGTTFFGYACANTTVPGVRTPATPSAAGVTGVSVSSVTATSMMVWVNRENTTATNINWKVESA